MFEAAGLLNVTVTPLAETLRTVAPVATPVPETSCEALIWKFGTVRLTVDAPFRPDPPAANAEVTNVGTGISAGFWFGW